MLAAWGVVQLLYFGSGSLEEFLNAGRRFEMKLGWMQLQYVAACCLLGVGSLAAGQGASAATVATPADAVNAQLSLVEGEMMGAVKAMPAERYSFAPSAAIFAPEQKTEFATVRTFVQQVTHVAQANYFFFSTLSGMKPDVDMKALPKITSKDEAVAALAGSFAFGHKAISTLTTANAFEVLKTPEPGLQTRATFGTFAVAHAFDHYGQMVEYLRMNGIVPPASAK
jgi:uncharacterized damage-inducible protein DinB